MSLFDEQLLDGAAQTVEKTGINILLISDYNIGGQYTYLMRAINKYSPHKARAIIWHDDQFSYDHDVLIDNIENQDFSELVELVKEADFFVFGRYIFGWSGVDFKEILNPKNCLVRYHGSFLRDAEPGKLSQMHLETGMHAMTALDWSMYAKLAGSFYHIQPFMSGLGDMDDSPSCIARDYMEGDTLKIIAGSGGSPNKGYDIMRQVVEDLKGEGYKVELFTYTNLTNEEFIDTKLDCHLCFTSLCGGGWGLSGVESMLIDQPVLCNVTPFLLSIYPDLPCILVDRETLIYEVREILEGNVDLGDLGDLHYTFARAHFNTKKLLAQFLYIIDTLRGADEYEMGNSLLPTIYDF